ncbi:unnamed protein product [Rotaria sp. Silwood1]|nr:unnamed protein product [Rotaria sp. Silwood1]CAF5056767.1 unnamed protein product [Rotaria sp. Silwood1]
MVKGDLIVPDLIGKKLEDAKKLIADKKLKLGKITYQTNNDIPPGQIVDQYPKKDKTANENTAVDLFVSRKKKVETEEKPAVDNTPNDKQQSEPDSKTDKTEKKKGVEKKETGDKEVTTPKSGNETPKKEPEKKKEEKDVAGFIPQRKINSYKYSSGKVFSLAGSKGLTGAAYLCSQSALISGSGAVILGIPDSLNTILARKLIEVMTLPLPETIEHTLSLASYEKIKEKIKWSDCLLLGPGVSKNYETLELISKIISENDVPMVLDADGLSAFKDLKIKKRKHKIILTPHLGEFANLLNISIDEVKADFYNLAKQYAKQNNVILVLKGSPSIITDGEYFYINSSGNPILSTAGSGDVLSGIIASLYSRTKDSLKSAVAGVYIHGKCADLIQTKNRNNFTFKASDLINKIPEAVNSILNNRI